MFDEEQRSFRAHLARWVDDRLVPLAQELDERGEFPRELFEELGGLG
jgi:alkylation response protein AidB-like acyl-CoA dehydrogenase